MDDEKQGGSPPLGEHPPSEGHTSVVAEAPHDPHNDDGGGFGGDFVYSPPVTQAIEPEVMPPSTEIAVRPAGTPMKPPPPLPPATDDEDDGDDEGMLRMSFMEHLEELRNRIVKMLAGLGVAFLLALVFAGKLWDIIEEPAKVALEHLKVIPPRLVMTVPMEGFSIIWVKLPLLCSIFLASPWIVYQAWSFIAPGLYKRERRWAAPFILVSAGLFIGGGLFAYFLAFRYGLEFLLGIGMSNSVQPMVTITEYFDLFVNVTLGVGIVFEMPVLIFLLTLLHLASPRFLIRHSRYAILVIVIIAAVVTPTPDVFNLMLFAVPMTLLYFVGVFAGYIVVLRREGKSLPWKKIWLGVFVALVLMGIVVAILIVRFGFKTVPHWPFLTK